MTIIKRLIAPMIVFLSLMAPLAVAMPAYADTAADCSQQGMDAITIDGVDGAVMCCPKGANNDRTKCLVLKYVNPAIRLLSAAAGVAVVMGIMIGGIQYASSGGDPQKAAAGKGKIVKSLVGLVAFFFLFSFLQFVSPGGISSNPAPSGSGGSLASRCSKSFFGLKPWFAYLPDSMFDGSTCQIKDFQLLGGNDTAGKPTPSNLPAVILAIVDNLSRVAALVAVAYVIMGGIKYTASNGEPESTKNAKDTIINALIGLVIAIIAASVVSFIGNRIVG
ncbi:hypothetical protein KDA06_02980 [Candidatus Saccharibacteria bacterium]|nr:hypothetical protein [Candidatus Saccharibacteria bacterium]HPR09287.1 hypothetical protein [Candidatus Saccharibacteria bacterium]